MRFQNITHPLLLAIVGITACGQQPPRLIVRGDDMGFSHAGNEALIRCYSEGIERSIEVLVPSPWFPEAVQLLHEHPGIDIGIHLTLTSEWDNIKWRPLTGPSSITDSAGFFHPFVWPNKNYPGRALLEAAWEIEDIEKELRAQIELGMKTMAGVSHVSAHMGFSNMSKEVTDLVERLCREYKIFIDLKGMGVKSVSYDGPHVTASEKVESFVRMLETLGPGETYLFVDHPGLDGDELKAIHHIGYEDVAGDRQGVVDTWTSQRVKDVIRERGIVLVGYADLRK